MGSVGAVLGKHNTTGRLTVKDTPTQMAAARAGILPGDEILMIDGRDVRPMTVEQVHDALSGPVGTDVDLTVLRSNEVLRLRVKRSPYISPRQSPDSGAPAPHHTRPH
jgi:C-terminal processing protease CtpA/Prc